MLKQNDTYPLTFHTRFTRSVGAVRVHTLAWPRSAGMVPFFAPLSSDSWWWWWSCGGGAAAVMNTDNKAAVLNYWHDTPRSLGRLTPAPLLQTQPTQPQTNHCCMYLLPYVSWCCGEQINVYTTTGSGFNWCMQGKQTFLLV